MKTFGRADHNCSPRTPFETGVVERYATPHPAYHIGPDVGIAVEWGWCAWRDAVADRDAELRAQRLARRTSLRARVLPAIVCGLGLVWGVVALMPLPRPVAVGLLVALALVGLALGRRR